MTGAIHQVVVGAAPGDAITTMAARLRQALRASGPSEIFGHHIDPELLGDVLPLADLRSRPAGSAIIYHASFGERAVTNALLARRDPIVLVYHNITPPHFYADHDPGFAAGLQWGRDELIVLRDRVRVAVAMSAFNAAELERVGYDDVSVMPVGMQPSRLRGIASDDEMARQLRERCPDGYVLSVSQLLPHKRFETLLQAMHLVQWVHELRHGVVIVGAPRLPRYQHALHRHAVQMNVRGVWFTGSVTDAELAAAYAGASLFVSTSAHEGLAVPPLEAMTFGVPVVARAAGAIGATIGGAGVLLAETAGPMLVSEAIAEVLTNDALATALVERGRDRIAEIERIDPVAAFVDLVSERI